MDHHHHHATTTHMHTATLTLPTVPAVGHHSPPPQGRSENAPRTYPATHAPCTTTLPALHTQEHHMHWLGGRPPVPPFPCGPSSPSHARQQPVPFTGTHPPAARHRLVPTRHVSLGRMLTVVSTEALIEAAAGVARAERALAGARAARDEAIRLAVRGGASTRDAAAAAGVSPAYAHAASVDGARTAAVKRTRRRRSVAS